MLSSLFINKGCAANSICISTALCFGSTITAAEFLKKKQTGALRLAVRVRHHAAVSGAVFGQGTGVTINGDRCNMTDATPSSNLKTALERVLARFKEADEERYHEQMEWEAESRKWKQKGDMYGCNFHQGMAAGANWASLFFFRVQRELEELIKASNADETSSKEARLIAALGMIYDKWEDGTSCYEDPEDFTGHLGNAVKLTAEEEMEILALIPTQRSSEKASAVRDSIAPNKHCPKCDHWFWLDKFDGHQCNAVNGLTNDG